MRVQLVIVAQSRQLFVVESSGVHLPPVISGPKLLIAAQMEIIFQRLTAQTGRDLIRPLGCQDVDAAFEDFGIT